MTPSEERDEALKLSRGLTASPANLLRVGRAVGEEAARRAFSQWELRTRAKTKFGRAEEMFFTREALEQSTHEAVAAYHASLFPAGADVIDITAGIGGDALALAARGPTRAVEMDEERLECLLRNATALGLAVDAVLGDGATALEAAENAYVFADPARRVAGRRTLDLAEFSPDPRRLAELGKRQRRLVMKLSPMLNDRDLESLGACVRFVSFGGECREALVFAGSDAPTGWEAVHLESGEMLTKPARETAVQMAEEPGEFLYEVDPAAIRAGLIGEVCAPIKAEPLADSNGYATSNQTCQSVWLTGYRVLGSCSSDAKQLKASLSKLGAGKLVLKQRHAGLDLEKMRRQFERGTGRPVTLAFYKNRKSIRCALLEAL